MRIFDKCKSLADSDLCSFTFLNEMPKRQFFNVRYGDCIEFIEEDNCARSYGTWSSKGSKRAMNFRIGTTKGETFIPLVSNKDYMSLLALSKSFHTEERRAFDWIVDNLGVTKKLDYLIAQMQKRKNQVKYHYIEFQPVAPDVFTKPRLYKNGSNNKCTRLLAEALGIDGEIGKCLHSKAKNGVVVYPLFERFASSSGFVYTDKLDFALGSRSYYAGGHLPCICVRVKGNEHPYYEISLEGPFEGEILATTKSTDKVDGIVREQVNKALLGVGNGRLHDVLTEKKWYRCIRRRYTNEEFIKDLQAKRAEYAAKFLDVWEMGNAFDFTLTDHEVRYSVWEICNSIINK